MTDDRCPMPTRGETITYETPDTPLNSINPLFFSSLLLFSVDLEKAL